MPPKAVDSIGLSRTPIQASSCLKELNLDSCHLSYLPEEIGNLISLQTLDLAKNNLSTLPDGICNLTCLKRLHLEKNNVSNLPSGIGRLTSLESLYLERNSLCTLPDTIGKLSCLKDLWVKNNNLSTLPEGICNLTCLKRLCLKENNVSNLPSGIGRLTSLESLNLSRNSLCTLPDTIGKLSCLKYLLVRNNKLSHLPSEIGDLDSLEELVLEGNNGFRALPESICKLVRLWRLNLKDCNLSHLPSEIDRLISLEYLYLARNTRLRSLSKLPTRISLIAACCPSLESLPLELDQLGSSANYSGSNKLAENNYLTSLLKQLPKSKRLSELKDVVHLLVPAGEEELRIWFPNHDGRGPNVSFVVPPPPSVNQNMLGWIIRVVVWAPRETSYRYQEALIDGVICNKIPCLGEVFQFAVYPTDVDQVCLIYIPQGYGGLQLEGGDEVEIPIRMYQTSGDEVEIEMYRAGADKVEIPIDVTHPNTYVKKWAIDLIYEGADEIHNGNDTCCHVVSI
ncbi:hypothetical protein RHSIM_Rhsim01G0098900 [Rhododendron simsii]|uniref:Disease resistance R13L4/SHOC-2-like LRR domain-containing protein n=1 Tax=Rhododendron simsii TaxID=118357 RepID=A0A834LYZ2_RHOSS|nr:hypothetical protein RHSIM_Rhsim01G0098900 [Rhododendron simsii]